MPKEDRQKPVNEKRQSIKPAKDSNLVDDDELDDILEDNESYEEDQITDEDEFDTEENEGETEETEETTSLNLKKTDARTSKQLQNRIAKNPKKIVASSPQKLSSSPKKSPLTVTFQKKPRRRVAWVRHLFKKTGPNKYLCLFKKHEKPGDCIIQTSNENTSHLITHAKTCHDDEIKEIVKLDEKGYDTTEVARREIAKENNSFKKHTNDITKYFKHLESNIDKTEKDTHYLLVICHQGISFNAACSNDMNDFMIEHGNFYLPSRQDLAGYILTGAYQIVEDCVKTTFKSEADFAAHTSDCWKGPCCDSFLSNTAHWITAKFEMRRATIGVEAICGSHTGQKLQMMIERRNRSFGPKVANAALVHDNGRDITKAGEIMFADSMLSVPCFAHTLQLAVRDVINHETYDTQICAAREIITIIRKSGLLSDKLRLVKGKAILRIEKRREDTFQFDCNHVEKL